MDRLDRQTWTLVSPLLDALLELPAHARPAYLDAVAATHPEVAALLTSLTAAHEAAVAENFLEIGPLVGMGGLAGQVVGPYVLERPLGTGGMGTVWLARRNDGRFDSLVALKFVHLAVLDAAGEARFRREGMALGRLSHPNIARLLDAGVTAAGQPYLVLEYVDGLSLDVYAARQRLDVTARLQLFQQIAGAVSHAHQQLVVHRDLKPSNVLVDATGQVKLLDFGIARLLAGDGSGEAATARAFTPEFAAPEQVTGAAASTAIDVYQLGVLLYRLLVDAHPTSAPGSHEASVVHALMETEPRRASAVAAALSATSAGDALVLSERRTTAAGLARACRGDLDVILATALRKDPADRYPSVAALAEDIRRHLATEPIVARRESALYRAHTFARRHWRGAAVLALALGALGAAAAGVYVQGQQSARDRDFALQQLARAEAAVDMNEFLLTDAAPLGRPFTAGDLLARAEALLNRQPADPPDAVLVQSLVSIGNQYQSQDEDGNARRVLARAVELAERLPDGQVTTRAVAGCAFAATLARGNLQDLQRAQALVAQSLPRIPEGRPFVLDRVRCERGAAAVARAAGNADEDLAHVLAARRLLTDSGLGSPLALLAIDLAVAEAARGAGHAAAAEAAFRAGFERMRGLGRDRTEDAGTLLNNWGLTLLALGRPLEADRVFRDSIGISQADDQLRSVSPMALLNAARPVLELGREDEAIAMIARAREEALRHDDQVVELQALLLLAGAHRQRGDLDRAAALFDEAEREVRERLPVGHGVYASLALQRSHIASARGQLDDAARLAAEGLRLAQANPTAGELVTAAELRLAQIAIALQHGSEAVDHATRAVTLERQRSQGDQPSSRLGRMLLVLGEAQMAAGRPADARAAWTDAARHLDATLGASHRDSTRVRALLAGPP